MVGDGIQEFVNDSDGPAFLERELVELDVDGFHRDLSAPAMSIDMSQVGFALFPSS